MKSENRKFITRDILLGILALPLVILLLSYFNTRPNNIKFNNPVKNDTIQNTTTTKENVSELSDTKNLEDSNKFYTIKAEYPIDAFDKEKSMENFVKYGFENKKEEWKVGGEAYNDYMKLKQDFPDRPEIKNEYIVNFKKFVSQKLGIHSYLFNQYEFTGGAHGNTSNATFNFNNKGYINLEKVLNLQNGNDLKITRMIYNKLPSILGDTFDKEMASSGLGLSYLKSDGITLDKAKCNCDGFLFASNLQNFIIGDDGITFVMGQYQVAPYVAGMPEVLIKWNELAPYVNKEFDLPLD